MITENSTLRTVFFLGRKPGEALGVAILAVGRESNNDNFRALLSFAFHKIFAALSSKLMRL